MLLEGVCVQTPLFFEHRHFWWSQREKKSGRKKDKNPTGFFFFVFLFFFVHFFSPKKQMSHALQGFGTAPKTLHMPLTDDDLEEYRNIIRASEADHQQCISIIDKYLPAIISEASTVFTESVNSENSDAAMVTTSRLSKYLDDLKISRWLIVDSLSLLCYKCTNYRQICLGLAEIPGSAPVARLNEGESCYHEHVFSSDSEESTQTCKVGGMPGKYDREYPNQDITKMESLCNSYPLRKAITTTKQKPLSLANAILFCLGRWITLSIISAYLITEDLIINNCSTPSGRRKLSPITDSLIFNMSGGSNLQKFLLDVCAGMRPAINQDILKRKLLRISEISGIQFSIPSIETGNRFAETTSTIPRRNHLGLLSTNGIFEKNPKANRLPRSFPKFNGTSSSEDDAAEEEDDVSRVEETRVENGDEEREESSGTVMNILNAHPPQRDPVFPDPMNAPFRLSELTNRRNQNIQQQQQSQQQQQQQQR